MVTGGAISRDAVFTILGAVMDPEVPVLSVVELGIVRDVVVADRGVTVILTPTYSGCPAMHAIEEDIRNALAERGVGPVSLETVYSPAWTTDWMSEEAKRKLEAYGIAPPGRLPDESLVPIRRRADTAPRCPYCGSLDTTVRSAFGTTACKAICYCNACLQPFEQFKAL